MTELETILANMKVEANPRILEAYVNSLTGSGKALGTALIAAKALRRLDNRMGKDFGTLTQEDLERYFAGLADLIRAGDLSASTVANERAVVKAFFKRRYPKLFPKVAGWITGTTIKRRRRQASDMVTHDEVLAIINAAPDYKYKALWALLWEGGLRIGEALSLTVGALNFQDHDVMAVTIPDVEGNKTGGRPVYLTWARPYLERWLENYSEAGNPSAPLWPSRRGGGIGYSTARNMLEKTVTKSGIRKDVTAHLLRHSACTEKARLSWDPNLMEQQFGWAPGSRMPSVYTHLATEDLKARVLRDAGKAPAAKPEAPKPRACPRCGKEAPESALFCSGCGTTLDLARVRAEIKAWDREVKAEDMSDEELAEEVRGLLGLALKRPRAAAIIMGKKAHRGGRMPRKGGFDDGLKDPAKADKLAAKVNKKKEAK